MLVKLAAKFTNPTYRNQYREQRVASVVLVDENRIGHEQRNSTVWILFIESLLRISDSMILVSWELGLK